MIQVKEGNDYRRAIIDSIIDLSDDITTSVKLNKKALKGELWSSSNKVIQERCFRCLEARKNKKMIFYI